MSKQCNKIVVIVTEGETDELFYTNILKVLREKAENRRFQANLIDTICVTGIGKFETKLYRTFRNKRQKYKEKYHNPEIYVFLCYDKDVFMGKNPPVNWTSVEKQLYEYGANKIHHIVADQSIEDFILLDYQGVLNYLRLSKNINRTYHGVNGLKQLFKLANKAYIKGQKADKLLNSLDFDLIEKKLCKQLSPLCQVLGIYCPKKQLVKA